VRLRADDKDRGSAVGDAPVKTAASPPSPTPAPNAEEQGEKEQGEQGDEHTGVRKQRHVILRAALH